MKLKAIIVDDEPLSRSFLQRYCEKLDTIDVQGSFEQAGTALNYLQKNEIDILFLDVEMPITNGFQLLDQLLYMPKVILTTSKTDYAYNAFEYKVVDYLKKPFTYNRFVEAVSKTTEATSTSSSAKQDVAKDDIYIKSDGKFTRLHFAEILYIESVGDYVKYFTATKNYLTLTTLKAVEEKIASTNFMKVHRSYIVNLSKIKDIQDNTLVIDGKVIPISKTLKPEVMSRINVM
jgi:two-component system, LytTR family, response regulator LytT